MRHWKNDRIHHLYSLAFLLIQFVIAKSNPEKALADIKVALEPVIGHRIARYQIAQLLHEDGLWDDYNDLPIRLFTDAGSLVSISWSQFDTLWISSDMSVPFSLEAVTVRWVENHIPVINPIVGQTIKAAFLGRGQLSIEGKDIEIWTRLVFELDLGWLAVYNALDENGYAYHRVQPKGVFVPCS